MLTVDDVRSIPLFSTLAVAELERLAQTSADLHLGAGEFVVHEGGDRALYAVLTGKIEVVKLFDGIERTIGWRVPGTIFGEVRYGASEGLRTLVVEREAPGGQAGTSSRIENYLGFPSGVSGDELASRALQQARRLGAEILVTRSVARIDPATRQVCLDGDDIVRGRTIILATGVTWRRLSVEGFDRLIGKGIYYGAARSEASATHGLDVYLIGAGNSAGQAALFFANHARSVTLIVRGDSLEKSMSRYLIDQLATKSNVTVQPHSEVVAAHGDTHLTAIDIRDGANGTVRRHDCGGLFVFIGADAETEWLPADIARDNRGYVLTGDDVVKAGRWSNGRDPYLLESSARGIFACGDVRLSPVKRVASAVGEGSMAIAFVHKYLQQNAQ
jgi:thioredoxin reductase (NADPH)